jgi:hypothetical protein
MDGLGDHLDDLGHGQWSQAFPRLAQTGRDQKLRTLLQQAEAAHRNSAKLMRSLGHEDRARRAEQFAAWVRLELDEPQLARLLYTLTRDLRGATRLRPLLDQALDGALLLLGADRGNVQVVDPVTRSLRIVAARGFGPDFLDYFAVVHDDGSACGRAAKEGTQTVVVDVNTDPGFAPHREIAAASGFRAVQSTPLVDRTGRLLGIISTHYPSPYRPPSRDLQMMQRFGQLVGAIMASRLNTVRDGPAGDPLGRTMASQFDSWQIVASASSMAKTRPR